MMPVCKDHGVWPCVTCKIKMYKVYSMENLSGKDPPHDLTELKKDIERLGGKI